MRDPRAAEPQTKPTTLYDSTVIPRRKAEPLDVATDNS